MGISERQVKNKRNSKGVPTGKPGTVYDVNIKYITAEGKKTYAGTMRMHEVLCAVHFLFQFCVNAGKQFVRRRCAGLCREHRRDAEPSAADQHFALFCDTVFLCVRHGIPENSCSLAILGPSKFCLLRHISAENTGVPVNLPILFHRTPFCLPRGGHFYRCWFIV